MQTHFHPTPRPTPSRPRRAPAGVCCICVQEPTYAAHRCRTCATYFYDHGYERPGYLFQKHCSRCGASPLKAAGLCDTCYVYRQRTGQNRPRYLFDPDAPCHNANCRRPLHLKGQAGYCDPCRLYVLRHGEERPARLTGGPGVWCECGERATRAIEAKVYGAFWGKAMRVRLDVCEGCYRLEHAF